MDDLKWQHYGWAEGEVDYNGQRCIRFVTIIEWMYPDSSELYKDIQRCFPKRSHRDGRELKLAIEVFLDDMEECGMVGHSRVLGRFENLSPRYSKNLTWEEVERRLDVQPTVPSKEESLALLYKKGQPPSATTGPLSWMDELSDGGIFDCDLFREAPETINLTSPIM